MADTTLRVWVLSDRQPGHYNQSRGIVAALARHRPVAVHWLELRLRLGLARNPLRWILNHCAEPPATDRLKLLVVSSGGKTSFANAWLARRTGARNIFAGSLRRLSPTLFDVVLTPEPITPATPANLVVALPPSAVDIARLEPAGRALRAAQRLEGQLLWALMLGGDGAGYRYRRRDWQTLARVLNRLAADGGARWLLLGSRRTGAAAERLLQQGLERRHVAASCWHRDAEVAPVEAYLGAADQVFVTEDSMTMLTEAISSQRPVVSLRPADVAPTARYAAMIERFAAHGWLCRYAIEELASGRRTLNDQRCRVLETPPLQTLSQQLVERLRL
jgi:mitochondrial fission protein ELM1